ncbi:alpha-amylase family protein [Pedobacter endophyticus]|uniref:Alpha-amylase family protein n=1 Tax=Pedobacter endophyticus TaxID=2789740 RepID=A0A7S9Q113_9SPHI|nr:alpha-amylase family protein [Pedobacter endophyticus]QPH41540.1 alpha-amylase family protein [Pedobacter endophyticus]
MKKSTNVKGFQPRASISKKHFSASGLTPFGELILNFHQKGKARILTLLITFTILSLSSCEQKKSQNMNDKQIVIYQLLPRLFGNKNTTNIPYGTIEQNGSGKFNDITDKALDGIKELHANYVWYTGALAHASLTDYSAYGIKVDDADVVKGRAGSAYAIRDYYDVNPDLAVDVKNRMNEFEELIKRTHAKDLKVIIDFVPNHVARSYHSYAKPKGVVDFGEKDDLNRSFSTQNDFYYLPGQPLVVPTNGQKTPLSVLQDGKFDENPAKATGNNVFSASPKYDDWYETIKLNYGVDYQNHEQQHFDPIPPVWTKMRDILIYWTNKGVDGFRCDMAEMVPIAFWNWVIPQVKQVKPDLIFLGEAYNPKVYKQYLNEGKFDYLYDKVGLYDGLKKLIRNEPSADVKDIRRVWQVESAGFGKHMLRFLENHDEERIASAGFAGKAELALPAMVVSATLGAGPVMLYFGQEVGEPGKGQEGFGGDDNRTTIFDYWGVPNHQKWMNGGLFDGGKLDEAQQNLRAYYKQLLKVTSTSDAVLHGDIYDVPQTGNMNNRMYAFIRYSANQRLLVVANFDRNQTLEANIEIPDDILKVKHSSPVTDLLTDKKLNIPAGTSIPVKLAPVTAQVIEF